MISLKRLVALLSIILLLCLVTACAPDKQSGRGLYLPEGNADKGKQDFIDLGCNWCHTVKGVDLPVVENEPAPFSIQLGGEVIRVKTYGELVTSIINPNHIISYQNRQVLEKLARDKDAEIKTLMPSFNDKMTVAQLVNLVTFLDAHYKQYIPEYSARGGYPIY